MDCPQCEAAALEPRGGKQVCPQCGYIEPCCETGAPARYH